MMAKKVKRAKKSTGGKDAYGFKKIATKSTAAQSKSFMETVKSGKMNWKGWDKI
jgi:hypothetical protein